MVRPCLSCGTLIAARRSYCGKCDPRPARVRATRGTRSQQTQFRDAVLKAADGRCEACGSTRQVEAHHVRALAAGGSHDPSNGRALCWTCHRR